MADLPFPVLGDSWEEARPGILALLRDIFENRVGGAYVGDVFQIGGDVFELKLAAGSGLKKTGGKLDIDINVIGTNGAVMKSSYTARGDIMVGTGPSAIGPMAIGAAGQIISSNGSDPFWKDFTASEVENVPAGTIAATDVQGAINDLDGEKAPKDAPTFTTSVQAPVYKSNDGTSGATEDVTVVTGVNFIASTVTTKVLHFKNGIFVGST